MKVTLPTPYDDIVPPVTTDAEMLTAGVFRITEIVAAGILVPGDVISTDGDGVITGFLEPAPVHVWELQYPPAWAGDIRRIEERASRYSEHAAVKATTTVSLCVASRDGFWLLTATRDDPDVEAIEQLRRPSHTLDLDALIARRYPNAISTEELEFDSWLNEED